MKKLAGRHTGRLLDRRTVGEAGYADERVKPLQAQGKTVVFILVDLKGAIALTDIVRPEAKQAIDTLISAASFSPATTRRQPNGCRTSSDWTNASSKCCPGTRLPK